MAEIDEVLHPDAQRLTHREGHVRSKSRMGGDPHQDAACLLDATELGHELFLVGGVTRARTAVDDGVRAQRPELANHVKLARGVIVGAAHDDREVVLGRDVLDSARKQRGVLAGHGLDDQADQVRALGY